MMKVLHIEGMRCGGCTGRVEKAIRALGYEVKMDLAAKTATVSGESLCDCTLKQTVEGLGFKVVEIR